MTDPAIWNKIFGVLMCLPTAPVLPSFKGSGDFGTSSFYGQRSGKFLPVGIHMGRNTPSTMRGFEHFN
jgi:hypothetical protein